MVYTCHQSRERTQYKVRSTCICLTWKMASMKWLVIAFNQNSHELLLYNDMPKEFANKLGTHILVYFNKIYLIDIDFSSKFFEFEQLSNALSSTVITQMKTIFAHYYMPKIVFSDNDKQHLS